MSDSHIFISYTSPDDVVFVVSLRAALEQAGFRVWSGGGDTEEGIRQAWVVLAVVSQASLKSASAQAEWTLAEQHHRPVLPLAVDLDEVPDGLFQRPAVFFGASFERGLARLRTTLWDIHRLHLALELLLNRRNHQRERRAGAPDLRRLETRLTEMGEQIAYKSRALLEPLRVAEEYEQITQEGINRDREHEARLRHLRHNLQRRRVVGGPAQEPAAGFGGRDNEMALITDALLSREEGSPQIVTIYGRPGTGKTALAHKVMQALAADYERIYGLVYMSTRSGLNITLEQLFLNVAVMLGGPDEKHLRELWTEAGLSTETRIQHLLEKLRGRRCVILLDNLEDLLDEEGRLQDADLALFLHMFLQHKHGGRLLLTSRTPLHSDSLPEGPVLVVPLEAGLPPDYAVNMLRALDSSGDLGLREADPTLLARVVERTGGFPRALEAVIGLLASDPFTTLENILSDDELFEGDLIEKLAQEAQQRLDPDAKTIMQALAVYGQPATEAAVRFLLLPYVDTYGIDVGATLRRLVRGRFIALNASTGEYVLHPLDHDYWYGQIPAGYSSDYNLEALERRAGNYYMQLRAPRNEWRSIADMEPQLAEFEHRLRAGDYDNAARLVNIIDFDYLSLWGHARRVQRMRERLVGHITDQELDSTNYNNLGLCYSALSQFDRAAECYNKAMEINQKLGRRGDVAVNLSNLGTVYSARGDRRKSIEYQTQALEIFRQLGHRKNEGTILSLLGGNHYVLGELQQAVEYYQQALEIAREVQDRRGEGSRLGNLGSIYHDLGQPERALDHYQQALEIAREVQDRVAEGGCLASIGSLYSSTGQPERALEYYEAALKIDREVGNRAGEGARLNNLGGLCSARGQPHKALEYYEAALKIDREVGNRAGEGARLGNIGDVYTSLGQYEKALEYQQQSLEIARETGIRHSEGSALASLGWIYSELRQYKLAVQYYSESLELARGIGDRYAECNRLGNLGSIYTDTGRYEDALTYHKQSLQIAREIGDPTNEAVRLMWLAWTYLDLADRGRARELLDEGLAITQRIGNRRWEENHLFALASTAVAERDYAAALDYIDRALEIAAELDNPGTLQSRLALKAEVLLYQERLEEGLAQAEQAASHQTPPAKRRHALLLYALLLARMGRAEEARAAAEENLALLQGLLDMTPELFSARYALAYTHALLALLSEGDEQAACVARAAMAFQTAREQCSARGVLEGALHFFEQLRPLDPQNLLAPARAMLKGL